MSDPRPCLATGYPELNRLGTSHALSRVREVGFVMISDGVSETFPEYLGPYFLWKLMIDARWQRQGLGTAALIDAPAQRG